MKNHADKGWGNGMLWAPKKARIHCRKSHQSCGKDNSFSQIVCSFHWPQSFFRFFIKYNLAMGFFVFTEFITGRWRSLFSFRMGSFDCHVGHALQPDNDSVAVCHQNPVANCDLFWRLVAIIFPQWFCLSYSLL